MKNVFQKLAVTFCLIMVAAFSSTLKAQDYEVYDGKEFSVMFTVRNGTAENVKFASRGAKTWTEFEVLESRNGNKAVFNAFVIDGQLNGYQIDYYEDGYIWVFNIDDNRKAIGTGWKLTLRQ
ncbi:MULTISPECIES: hypothetical protein [Chryseobacterium]|uniref:hypothetical protein n=1 Tax=Chryseobacterium sp. R2A-55 TaxID=2744445 RepID=UPI001F443446|nr:hypothetical protein [Chryseobacterium sp. R2A-55]